MEDNRLVRVFDHIRLSPEREEAMLADLLSEKKEVSSMKQNRKRRIPAAALVAAVLVIALAGTAAAYLSRVTVAPYVDGYSVHAETGNIPLSSLPDDLLERAADSDRGQELMPFDSWEEAEAYLGLEIADNARLDQMEKGLCGMSLSENEKPVVSPSILDLLYSNGLPDQIGLQASYKEGDLWVRVDAVLMVENPAFGEDSAYSFANPSAELIGTETYVTPCGMEATIVTSQVSYAESFTRTEYEAQFILNRAFFQVKTNVKEGESGEEALTLLKEVLDAYQ